VVARRTILLAIARSGSPGIRGSGYTARSNVVFLATRNITADTSAKKDLHFDRNLTAPAIRAISLYNMMNNEDVYGTLNLHPVSKLSLRSEVHALRLASASDLWYSGGGAFQPKTF
jgi:hypothetical protein